MNLPELFTSAVPCMIGFISRAVIASSPSPPPVFPPIFGTGFFADRDGVVVTNRHVIEAFKNLPPPHPETKQSPLAAILLVPGTGNWGMLVIDVRESTFLREFKSTGRWFGQAIPDFGFVQLNIRDVPFLRLASEDFYVRVGMEIATIGYPTGTKSLTIHNKLNQITPFIRHGIVSSVFPFPTAHPDGFTIDVLQQSGSSGSPVFSTDGLTVIGLMASSVVDLEEYELHGKTIEYPQNTNISVAEPAHIIKQALEQYLRDRSFDVTALPTLDQMIQQEKLRSGKNELEWISSRVIYPRRVG